MKKRFLALVLLSIWIGIGSAFAQRIVGYLPSYRDPNDANIRYSCLTDVYYSFINFDVSGNLITNNPSDAIFGFDMSNFTIAKTKCKPQVASGPRLWIAVSGADNSGQRKARFATVASSSGTRATLISQLVSFCNTHNLAGIDIDWEFPANNATERNNHQAFMTELRTAVNTFNTANPSKALKISLCVGGETNPALGSPTHKDYCNPAALGAADYVHCMTYDLPAPYGVDHAGVAQSQYSVTQWQAHGGSNSPWSKMNIGIGFYGRPNPRGADLTRAYNDPAENANATNIYNSSAANQGLSASGYYYDSKQDIIDKVNWIMSQGGAGVIIWDLGQDRATPINLQDATCAAMIVACVAPQPNLGADVGVCLPGTINLNSNVATGAWTFSWKEDGVSMSGQTGATMTRSTSGLSVGSHTYEVTVTSTASGCTRTSSVNVVLSNPVTATGATRCGTGTAVLNVTSTGSTYEWYDAATAGNKLGTGSAFTTPSISTTTDYWVQEATGSTNSYTAKPTINVPNAQVEFASDANPGTKPQWTQKFTALQSLTLASVTIYTNGSARSNAKIIAYSSIDGSVVASSTPVNIPTMTGGTPYTLNCNLFLPAGTYYIGIYIPTTNSGNACIWSEAGYTGTTPFTLAGISSLEPKSYQGNFLVATPSTSYGQLFNWVVTTGVVNPCPRTKVTATVTTATPTTITGSATPVSGCSTTYSVAVIAGTSSYTWTVPAGWNITAGAGTTSITVTPSATAGNISVNPIGATCGSVTPLSVTPSAGVSVSSALTGAVCSGNPYTYTITSATAGATFSWTRATVAGISNAAGSGSTASISETLTNTTTAPINVTYALVATSGACSSAPVNLVVTVNPKPTITSALTATVCSGSAFNYTATSATVGATFTWTRAAVAGISNTASGGVTAAISETLVNTTAAAVNVTYVLTPAATCLGVVSNLVVTVNPRPTISSALTSTVCSGVALSYTATSSVTGATFAWTRASVVGITPATGTGATASIAETLTNSTSSPVNVTYVITPTAATCAGTASNLVVTVNPTPATPAAPTGTATVCQSTINNYTVTAVAGATGYVWTLPGGWTGTSTTNTIAATAGATGGNITVRATNACGTSSASSALAVTVSGAATAPSAPTGNATVCQGSSNVYTVAAVSGASSYTWTLPSGWTGTSTLNSITAIAGATGGNITVSATTTCGVSAASAPLAVTVNARPTISSALTATVCSGTALSYTATSATAGATFAWTRAAVAGITPSTGSGTTAAIAETLTNSTTAAINVTYVITPTANSCVGTASNLVVTVNPTTSTPAAPTGSATVCQGASVTYTVAAVTGATSYSWTLPAGWSGTSTTNSITATTGATGGNITVTATNSCGTSSSSPALAVTVSGAATAPSAPTGSASVCQGSSNVYTVTSVAGATGYTWTLPAGWSGSSTTNSITATAGATGGNITVSAITTCGTSAASAPLAVTVTGAITAPGTITGSATPCNAVSTTYSITSVAGATGYNWTFPSGWTVTSGAGTISVTVTPSSTSGNVSVVATTASCGNSAASTKAVTVGSAPVVSGAPTGSATVCQGASATYTIATVAGATSYAWTLPAGWSGTSTTNSISATAGSTGGNITVAATNACGTSSASSPLAVTVSGAATAPSAPTGTASVCQGSSNVYTVAAVSGATSYTWTKPSGWTGTSTTNSITLVAGATGGNITVSATTTCGTSPASSPLVVTISGSVTAPGSITGSATACSGIDQTYSITDVGASSYTWTVPSGWTIVSGQGTTTLVATANATSGTVSVVANSVSCGASAASNLAVTASSCTANNPGTITGPSVVSTGQTATYFVSNQPGVTFTWTVPTGVTIISGQGTNSITVSFTSGAPASSTISVVAVVGATTSSPSSKTITNQGGVVTGVEELTSAEFEVSVYPNPTENDATIKVNLVKNAKVSVSVYDVIGNLVKVVADENLTPGVYEYSVNNLVNGLYIVKAKAGDDMKVIKVIKR